MHAKRVDSLVPQSPHKRTRAKSYGGGDSARNKVWDVLRKLPLIRLLLMVRSKDTVHATGVTGRLVPLRRLARCKLNAEQEQSPVESFRMLWRGKLAVSHCSPTSRLQASWVTLQ
jgi:hypothetical protein